jgi:hypothetical protein
MLKKIKRNVGQFMEQAVTEMTKSWRAKGETHGIPHRSDHHGDTEGLQTYAMLISLQRTSSCIVD